MLVSAKKAQALLAIIASDPDGIVSRNVLCKKLWPFSDCNSQKGSLRTELAKLRRALGDIDNTLLANQGNDIRMDLGAFDLSQFKEPNAETIEREFLEGIDIPHVEYFEDWLREQRRNFAVRAEMFCAPAQSNSAAHGEILDDAMLDPIALTLGKMTVPRRPSMAMLAVRNISGSSQMDRTAGALREALRTALSQFPTFVLIDAPTINADQMTPQNVGQKLGAHHLLDSSVSEDAKGSKRLRVQLVDCVQGAIEWSCDHVIDQLETIDAQCDLAAEIAARVDGSVEKTTRKIAASTHANSLDVYGKIWAANNLYREWSTASLQQAMDLLDQALVENPQEAWAAAMSAFINAQMYALNWPGDRESFRQRSLEMLVIARRYAGDDVNILGYCAGAMGTLGHELDQARRLIERAIAIAPNFVGNYVWAGWIELSLGNYQAALSHFKKAMRLSPQSAARPLTVTGMGVCSIGLREFGQADVLLTEAVQELPEHPLALAAAAIAAELCGKSREAENYSKRLAVHGGATALLNLLRNKPAAAEFGKVLATIESRAWP